MNIVMTVNSSNFVDEFQKCNRRNASMFRLVDVDVVFDDFESEHLLGKWYVDFGQVDGFGSKKGLTEHLIRAYKKQGKKVMYLTVWPSEKMSAE